MTDSLLRLYHEPVAIIGIGCRFPAGLNDPDAFWRFLCDARVAAGDIPPDRWNPLTFYDPDPDKPGTTNMRRASFLEQIDQMDAEFFGISPREAPGIDPQHRLLLETAWEALEDAGQVAERLAGSPTGVFIGISRSDYEGVTIHNVDLIHAYTNSGVSLSVAANRVSYVFDFRGPSMAVDTACASALTAVHLACQSLRQGECSLAMAGGASVLIRPHFSIGYTKAHMLAADGRCKTFDAEADGFGRAEGVGVVVLKRLADALADRDPIYAVVRGSGINTDGHKSGIMLPSAEGQAALLRDVYRRAGVAVDRVGYVEAHGTGTPVGDPIEVEALAQALGAGRRPGSVCLVGSAKANVGHLSSAAGIVGLIKAALCLHHRQVPPQPLLEHLNPQIPFDRLPFRVPLQLEPFPAGSEPAIAGVSAFGFGGANAHIILEEAPSAAPEELPAAATALHESGVSMPAPAEPYLMPLAARSPEALRAFAQACRDAIGALPAETGLQNLGYSLGVRRSHHDYRLALTAHSRPEALELLDAFLAGEDHTGLAVGRRVPGERPKIAFVCSGMGPQWWGMGRQLLAREPVFRDAVARCDAVVRRDAGWSLLEALTADEASSRLADSSVAQPAMFALQVALAALWQSWGLMPDAVVGHSTGEVAAAHVAGALSLEDAVRVICHRSRLQQRTAGIGGMLAVGLSPEDAAREAAQWAGRVSVAALNSPLSATLSGETRALDQIAAACEAKGIFCRFLKVPSPAHSHYLDPLRGELEDVLQTLRPRPESLPLFSTVTGRRAEGEALGAAYWWRNMRQPVYFAAAMQAMIDEGYRIFVEVSPHPVLAGSIAECLTAAGQEGTALPSLRRHEDEKAVMWGTLGALYARGHPVAWDRLYRSGRFVGFPRYPWQRRRFWLESEASRRERLGQDDHPLLGRRQNTACPMWETKADPHRLPLLADHRVQGTAVFPGAGYIEMGLAAARVMFGTGPYVVDGLEIHQPMAFPPSSAARAVQSVYTPADGRCEIYSRSAEDKSPWILHAALRLPPPAARHDEVPPLLPLDAIQSRCRTEVPMAAFIAEKEQAGQTLGPRFRGVRQLWVGHEEALARIEAPEAVQTEWDAYLFHPGLVDACIQLMHAIVMAEHGREMDGLYLPTQVARARLFGRAASRLWAYARIRKRDARARTADLVLCDEGGNVVLALDGVESRYLEGTGRRHQHFDWLYEPRWHLEPRAGDVPCQTAHDLPRPWQLAALAGGATRSPAGGPDDQQEGFESGLDRLAAAYVERAFAELTWPWRAADRVSLAEAAEVLRVPRRRERLLARCLSVLEEDGVLDRSDAGWTVRRVPAREDPGRLQIRWQTLLREWPAGYAELKLLRSAGDNLARVLRDEVDPLELLFPAGERASAEWYFQDSPTYRQTNEQVRQIVGAALDSLPPWRPLRIVEVGGGLGGTAAYVLPALSTGRAQYVFTDSSPSFLAHTQQRFGDRPFVECRPLALERDLPEQGFAPHAFDLVLVSSFRCAAAGLASTLQRLRQLLASGGLLVVAEPLLGRTRRWSDIAFGALPGYWPFADAGPAAEIRGALEEAGFAEVEAVADAGWDGLPAVLVGRGPRVEAPAPPAAPAELPRDARNWLIFADRRNVAERVAQWLRERGAACVLVDHGDAFARQAADRFQVRPTSGEDIGRVLDALRTEQPTWGHILHLWSLDIPASDTLPSAVLAQSQALGVLAVVQLVKALDAAKWTPRLWLATGGTQLESRAVAQAPLWGLGRVIQNEHPEFQCMLVDLSADGGDAEAQALCAELVSVTAEREIALRGRDRWVPRLHRLPAERLRMVRRQAEPLRDGFRATVPVPGTVDNVRLETAPRRAPGAGEVEIEVFAAALNFKDVLTALAVIPAERMLLGLESAGRISAVGEGVEGLRVGEDVVALAPGCLGSFVTAPAALVFRKPSGVSFTAAVTLPVAFLTACYGLEHLGRLARGERVLIHAATGGVGLAAIQIARRRGAEVFATAGSPEKRELLRQMGVEHVMDSRSLDFAGEVMRRTRGEGVDVILNSLAGEAIERGLAVLRPGGRFVDISKTDILADHRVGLRVFEKNLSYAALDLSQLRAQHPELVGTLLRDMVQRLEAGAIWPLPHRVFSIGHVAEAFRHFAKTRHVGKIVIDVKAEEAPHVRVAPEALFRADAAYLITGGLGGFGMATAEWMAARGARHLALIGRSGAASTAAQAAVERLRDAGVTVKVFKADATRESDLAQVLDELGRSCPPLRGVVHAAMVLDDGALLRTDADRFMNVLAPKMLGAWNLHRLTADAPLDVYLLYSSVAVLHGHPVQGNYAAGNAFLDALAWHRRASGRPATTVDWGAIADVGYMAEHDEVARAIKRAAVVVPFPAADALSALEAALPDAPPQIGIFHHDWGQFQRAYPISASPRFAEFAAEARTARDAAAAGPGASLRTQLSAAPPEQRHTLIESALRARISKTMGFSGAQLDAAQPLVTLGLDSLMAIELRAWIQSELGRDVSIMTLLGGATLAQLVTELSGQVHTGNGEAPAAAHRPIELEEIRL